MPKQGFRRQRLLDVKSILLNLKSIALRESEDKERGHRKHLASIEEEKKKHLGNSGNHEEQVMTTRDLQIETWYTEQLNEDLRQQVRQVQLAEEEVQEKRKIVEKSAREKKSLEKLKERQELAASKERARKEQKDLDEIAKRQKTPGSGKV